MLDKKNMERIEQLFSRFGRSMQHNIDVCVAQMAHAERRMTARELDECPPDKPEPIDELADAVETVRESCRVDDDLSTVVVGALQQSIDELHEAVERNTNAVNNDIVTAEQIMDRMDKRHAEPSRLEIVSERMMTLLDVLIVVGQRNVNALTENTKARDRATELTERVIERNDARDKLVKIKEYNLTVDLEKSPLEKTFEMLDKKSKPPATLHTMCGEPGVEPQSPVVCLVCKKTIAKGDGFYSESTFGSGGPFYVRCTDCYHSGADVVEPSVENDISEMLQQIVDDADIVCDACGVGVGPLMKVNVQLVGGDMVVLCGSCSLVGGHNTCPDCDVNFVDDSGVINATKHCEMCVEKQVEMVERDVEMSVENQVEMVGRAHAEMTLKTFHGAGNEKRVQHITCLKCRGDAVKFVEKYNEKLGYFVCVSNGCGWRWRTLCVKCKHANVDTVHRITHANGSKTYDFKCGKPSCGHNWRFAETVA